MGTIVFLPSRPGVRWKLRNFNLKDNNISRISQPGFWGYVPAGSTKVTQTFELQHPGKNYSYHLLCHDTERVE